MKWSNEKKKEGRRGGRIDHGASGKGDRKSKLVAKRYEMVSGSLALPYCFFLLFLL